MKRLIFLSAAMILVWILIGFKAENTNHTDIDVPENPQQPVDIIPVPEMPNDTSSEEVHSLTAVTILDEFHYDFNHDGEDELLELTTYMHEELPDQFSHCELRVLEQDGTLLWMTEAGAAHVGWNSVFACEINGKDYLMIYNPYANTGIASYAYRIFSIGKEGNEELFKENQVTFDLMFGSNVHEPFPTEKVIAFMEEVYSYLDKSEMILTTEQGSLVVGGKGKDFKYGRFWDSTMDIPDSSMADQIRAYVTLRETNVKTAEQEESLTPNTDLSKVSKTSEFSFEKTTFHYGEHSYDLTSRVKAINHILSAVLVGEKIVIEGHAGPKNGVYCIFDTVDETFDSDLKGNHLTWYNDDITTAVYSFWSDVYAYDGNIIRSYDLTENEFIYDLAFSDDHTALRVTIVAEDETERVDIIRL